MQAITKRSSYAPTEWLTTLEETRDEAAYGAIERLVEAGKEAGYTVHDMTALLNAGMALESLLDRIEEKLAAEWIEQQPQAA
jgi:hypothetical protein